MHNKLSPRLQVCAGFVHPGDRVADVGCDHGYLSIYLIQSGIASSVIASDVVEGPLHSAMRNAERFGVAHKIRFYLCDGVTGIARDFDTLICAGMGADTMISILSAAPWLRGGSYRLILQCQSKTPALRRYLTQNGWHIAAESVVRDGRFLYTVMEVVFCAGKALTPGEEYFPPALLIHPGPDTPAYYRQVLQRLRRAVAGQKDSADPALKAALEELENKPCLQGWKESES